MKFSSKLALLAATTLVSVSAFAAPDMSAITDVDAIDSMAAEELASPGTATDSGSVAVIGQSGADQIAMILQEGDNNFAAITQAADAAVAAIVQSGSTGTAYISQK